MNTHIRPHAEKLLESLPAAGPENFSKIRERGHARGIDFYGRDNMLMTLSWSMYQFFTARRALPVHPDEAESLFEKIFWAKFLMPMTLPTPADKLAVSDFIPAALTSKLNVPKVNWSGGFDGLEHVDLPPGNYYFKANHGNNTARPVQFPISTQEREKLIEIGRAWLKKRNHNVIGGEWWYSTIAPTLYLEEAIVSQSRGLMEYKFYTVGGQTVCVTSPRYDGSNHPATNSIYDENFQWLSDVQLLNQPNPQHDRPPDHDALLEIANCIGEQFDFVRVDIYNPSPGVILLGELTLSPYAGCAMFNAPDFEKHLGAAWDMGGYLSGKDKSAEAPSRRS